ncbi:MAG: hypothetical protein KatS3mg087_1770 [Patescibacteria group bacterium]|nr:MAG: hypothetical protein KatS3mg087_1770 [Patescibacteria group bacterium]
MTSEQFKKAWGENAAMALLSFLKGLGQLGSEEQLKVLDQLGFQGHGNNTHHSQSSQQYGFVEKVFVNKCQELD